MFSASQFWKPRKSDQLLQNQSFFCSHKMLFFLNVIIFLCLVDRMESMLYSPDQCITDFTISTYAASKTTSGMFFPITSVPFGVSVWKHRSRTIDAVHCYDLLSKSPGTSL